MNVLLLLFTFSLTTLIASATMYCGDSKIPFNEQIQMCCSGMVFGRNTTFIICCKDRIFGLGDPTAKQYWDCCNDQAYDTRYQECSSGRPRARLMTENLGTTKPMLKIDYVEPTEQYVDAWKPPIETTPSKSDFTPPPVQASVLPVETVNHVDHVKTDDSESDSNETCSGRSYDTKNQVCCGGYVYVRSTPTVLCCAGALFAVGEIDGDKYWACCAHTIFDHRRQFCSSGGIVMQKPDEKPVAVTKTHRIVTTSTTPTTTTTSLKPQQPVTAATRPYFPNVITVPKPETNGNANIPPQTLPPPTFAGPVPSGFRSVRCHSGELLQVKDEGNPMACCGRSLYDPTEHVCIGDQYTVHMSLMPGLPSFFVGSSPQQPKVTTTKTTPTTTQAPTTTTASHLFDLQTQKNEDSGHGTIQKNMEISCNGNSYKIPLNRLSKVACCGQYLYDSRYYKCQNGAVVSINSVDTVAVTEPPVQPVAPHTNPYVQPQAPVTQPGEYVTSMPFVHSFFPTPGLPIPVQPRSLGQSEDSTEFLAPQKPIVETQRKLPTPVQNTQSQVPNTVINSPMSKTPLQPVKPVKRPMQPQMETGSLPYVPSWNPRPAIPRLPSQRKNVTKVNPAYGSQLSLWNQLDGAGRLGSPGSQQIPFAGMPFTFDKMAQMSLKPTTSPPLQQKNPFMPKPLKRQRFSPPLNMPQGDSNFRPPFMPQPSRFSLPKPINSMKSQKQPIQPVFTFNNQWMNPTSFENRPIPGQQRQNKNYQTNSNDDMQRPIHGRNRQNSNYQMNSNDEVQRPSHGQSRQNNNYQMNSNDDLQRQRQWQRRNMGKSAQKSSFMMTPVTPMDSEPLPSYSDPVSASHSRLPLSNFRQEYPNRKAELSQHRLPAKKIEGMCQNGRLLKAPSNDQDFVYCCDNTPYDIRSQFCCGGTVEEWIASDDGKVYQLCCSGVYIYNVNGDPNVQCCGRTAINTKYEPCASV